MCGVCNFPFSCTHCLPAYLFTYLLTYSLTLYHSVYVCMIEWICDLKFVCVCVYRWFGIHHQNHQAIVFNDNSLINRQCRQILFNVIYARAMWLIKKSNEDEDGDDEKTHRFVKLKWIFTVHCYNYSTGAWSLNTQTQIQIKLLNFSHYITCVHRIGECCCCCCIFLIKWNYVLEWLVWVRMHIYIYIVRYLFNTVCNAITLLFGCLRVSATTSMFIFLCLFTVRSYKIAFSMHDTVNVYFMRSLFFLLLFFIHSHTHI